jgi:hypothetical protein
MPDTVDDFMRRFAGDGSIDDHQASQYYDRFASADERDRDFDNDTMHEGATEYLGKLPDHQFQEAARTAYAQAAPPQRQGLLQTILGGLQGRGVDLGSLGRSLGLGAVDPQRMEPDAYAKIANYARREHPDLIKQTVKEQPWFMKALGNPFVMGALGVVAARMLRKR